MTTPTRRYQSRDIVWDEFNAVSPSSLGDRMVWDQHGAVREHGHEVYRAVWRKHTLLERLAVGAKRRPIFEALLPVLQRIGAVLRAAEGGERYSVDARTFASHLNVSVYVRAHLRRVVDLHQHIMTGDERMFDVPPTLDTDVYTTEERRQILTAWNVMKEDHSGGDTDSEEGVEQGQL